jgi:hypothetical protein
MNGFGYLFFPKGGYLAGNFEKNKINGVGCLNYPNCSKLLGYWRRSQMHGPFFNYHPDKKVWIECEYNDGILMRYGREEAFEEKNQEVPLIIKDYPELKELFEMLDKKDFLKNFDRSKVMIHRFLHNIFNEIRIRMLKNYQLLNSARILCNFN